MYDATILIGMLVLDCIILAVWWFLGSRFVSPSGNMSADNAASASFPPASESLFHRVLGNASLILLTGLVVECVGMFIAILYVYGWA